MSSTIMIWWARPRRMAEDGSSAVLELVVRDHRHAALFIFCHTLRTARNKHAYEQSILPVRCENSILARDVGWSFVVDTRAMRRKEARVFICHVGRALSLGRQARSRERSQVCAKDTLALAWNLGYHHCGPTGCLAPRACGGLRSGETLALVRCRPLAGTGDDPHVLHRFHV